MIYLDNAATTKPFKEVTEQIKDTLLNSWGNPSSLHDYGLKAEIILDEARKIIASSINTEKENIFFSPSGTLSNNVAIFGAVDALKKRGNHIITTSIEHISVTNPFKELEKKGFNITYISPNLNKNDLLEKILNNLTDETIFVSIMMVNNETGQIFDVFEIAKQIKKINPLTIFHTDAVQAFMKFDINLKNSDIDLLSFSGHKIHAPKGIGGLYVKKGSRINPTFFGGNQENGYFPGTQNVSFASGLGMSVNLLKNDIANNYRNMLQLSDLVIEEMPKINGSFLNLPVISSPYILSLGIKGIKSEILLHYLSNKNIFVSNGSACSKGVKSKVLSAYKINNELIDYTIRISFNPFTTKNDINQFLEALTQANKEIIKI